MIARETVTATLRGQAHERTAVCPHWYGAYKFEHAGLARDHDDVERLRLYGSELAAVDIAFYRRFRPDWVQLATTPWAATPARFQGEEQRRLTLALAQCQSMSDIEDYVAFTNMTEAEMVATRSYEHVPAVVRELGHEAYVVMNEGNPINGILDPNGPIGFERGLIALLAEPAFMERLTWRLYEQRLDWVRLLAKTGVHGYFTSETYCGADLIAPDTWRNVILPAQRMFYQAVGQMGLEPICYFCGDVNPLVEDFGSMGATAIQFEDSKKSFALDVVALRRRLSPDVTLLGNLDSVSVLLDGTPEDVRRETARQLTAAAHGPFIMANGSPIAMHTPAANLDAMRDATAA